MTCDFGRIINYDDWPSRLSLIVFFIYVVCRGSVYRALGLMVAASPCALAAAPLAYATAISACAKKVISNLAQYCDFGKLLLNICE